MIESKKLVPTVYSNSRDYRAILKLLDIVVNSYKFECDNLSRLITPELCPESLLPDLASYMGYNYDYNIPADSNRIIIDNYPLLIHNRGNISGISKAVAIAINIFNKYNTNTVSLFDILYDRENNVLNILIYGDNYSSKIYDLLEVVRPAGTKFRIEIASNISLSDQSDIYDNITSIAVYDYDPDKLDKQTMDNYTVCIGNYKLIINYVVPELIQKSNYYITGDYDENNIGTYSFLTDNDGYIKGYKLYKDYERENIDDIISTPYKIINGNIIFYDRDTDINNHEIIMTREYIEKYIITDRFKVGLRNRIGFGEVNSPNRNYPIIFIKVPDNNYEVTISVDNNDMSSSIKSLNGNYKYIELESNSLDESYNISVSVDPNHNIITSGDLYVDLSDSNNFRYSSVSFEKI